MFKKMKVLAGDVDPELLAQGALGRAIVKTVERTGVFAGPADFDARQVCEFDLAVRLDNEPPFDVHVRQQIPTPDLAQMVPGQTFVAVRVDPDDHSRAVIDLSTPPPVVTISSSDGRSASDILAEGTPVRAVVVDSSRYYAKNLKGVEIYVLTLTVLAEGHPPMQLATGNPVPEAALPLLYPGSNLPAKQMADPPDDLAIDWDAALAQFSN